MPRDVIAMPEVVKRASEKFFNSNEPFLGHYFRNLFSIVKYVAESNIGNKDFYIDIVRNQLSDDEILFMFSYGLTDFGAEYKKLIENNRLLKRLTYEYREEYGKKISIEKDGLYADSAFG